MGGHKRTRAIGIFFFAFGRAVLRNSNIITKNCCIFLRTRNQDNSIPERLGMLDIDVLKGGKGLSGCLEVQDRE